MSGAVTITSGTVTVSGAVTITSGTVAISGTVPISITGSTVTLDTNITGGYTPSLEESHTAETPTGHSGAIRIWFPTNFPSGTPNNYIVVAPNKITSYQITVIMATSTTFAGRHMWR